MGFRNRQLGCLLADGSRWPVFVGCDDENLYAVDAETGTRQWAFETASWVRSSPTVADGTVFAGCEHYNLYAVDAETGTQQWLFQTGGPVRSSPTVVDSTVFVGSGDGNLYAVDTETGIQQWAFEIDWIESAPTVVDGTVFVGSHDEHVYALDADVDGSSEDSRVALGTLGHHHEWAAEQATDESGEPDGPTEDEPPAEHDSGVDQDVFDAVDQDGDGDITLEELVNANLERLGDPNNEVNGVEVALEELVELNIWRITG